jgi:hypothetical protein
VVYPKLLRVSVKEVLNKIHFLLPVSLPRWAGCDKLPLKF